MLTSGAVARRSSFDDWLGDHVEVVALVMLALGCALRLVKAANGFLNPDEALHYLIAHQTSLARVYQSSLTNAHPFLFFVLLHVWLMLGSSELALRLVSVLAGTAAGWFGFKWLTCRFDKSTGLGGLVLLAFDPVLVSLSAQVRQYALLLLFMAVALYTLQRALQEGSCWMLSWFTLALLAANVTQYSAIWFTIAVGLYGVAEVIRRRQSARWFLLWAGGQLAVVALLVFQYRTHIGPMRGSAVERFAREGWLQSYYFQPGRDRFGPFLEFAAGKLFTYLFASLTAGAVAMVLFAAGVALMLTRGCSRSGRTTGPACAPGKEEWSFGMLLLAGFGANVAAAIAGVYPFGGSRHSVFLILFAVAGISYLLGRLAGRRLHLVVLGALLAVPLWQCGTALDEKWSYPDQGRQLMVAAVRYVRDSIPGGSLMLVDYETSELLGYYLGRNQPTTRFSTLDDGFLELPYGGYRVVSSARWSLSPDVFRSELRAFRHQFVLDDTTWVWVADGCWGRGTTLDAALVAANPRYEIGSRRNFGRNLAVFQVREAFR